MRCPTAPVLVKLSNARNVERFYAEVVIKEVHVRKERPVQKLVGVQDVVAV